jgi:hypothetical protein
VNAAGDREGEAVTVGSGLAVPEESDPLPASEVLVGVGEAESEGEADGDALGTTAAAAQSAVSTLASFAAAGT